MKKVLSLGFSTLTLLSCAKERPVEKVLDFDNNRYEKSTLNSQAQWMYKATVIETSTEGGVSFVGASTPMYLGRFEFGRDKLKFYNNVTPYSDKGVGISPDLVNSWDIEHSSYRLIESDGKVLNKEEEDTKISWETKPYFKINWTSQSIDMLGESSDCFKKLNDSLVEGSQEATPEHFSFTVESTYQLVDSCSSYSSLKRRLNAFNLTFTMKVKHSFAPLQPSDYQPLVYKNQFDERRRSYGFFETVVDRMNDETGRFEKVILANRWHPEKEHTIYLTGDFPEDYEWIYTHPTMGIAAVTNQLFSENGLKMRIRFAKDPSKKYGDVRYSFVKFVDKYDDQAPLGYGPSDANPLTGEIIRSDTVIWTALLKDYVRQIRDYEAIDPKLDESLVFRKMGEILEKAGVGSNESSWLKTAQRFDDRNMKYDTSDETEIPGHRAQSRYELQKIISENLYSNPWYASYTNVFAETSTNDKSFDSVLEETNRGSSTLARTVALMNRTGLQLPDDIRRKLSSAKNFVEKHSQASHRLHQLRLRNQRNPDCIFPVENQLASVLPMMHAGKSDQQIIDTILYRVAIHEFGHNLNLRHNFYGSVDYQNFPEVKAQRDRNGEVITRNVDGQTSEMLSTPSSSSVMDYLALADEYNVEHNWESYDKAALIFAYSGGKVDLARVELDPNTRTYVKRETPRIFLYCTDEHRFWNNPFCDAFDVGTTPSEIVMSHIRNYARSYTIRNTPYGRAYWDVSGYEAYIADAMLSPLKMLALYDQIGMWLSQMSDIKSFPDAKDYGRVYQEISEDSRRAATLLASFYAGVVKFSDSERQLNDSIDRFTGDYRRLGVFIDKLYATFALGGNLPIAIDSLVAPNETNFMKYVEQGDELGAVVRDQLLDVAVENIEWARIGLESFGRSLLVATATEPTGSNLGFLKRMKLTCYTRAGLKQAFGLDADQYYPYFVGSKLLDPLPEDLALKASSSLNAGIVQLGGGLTKPLIGQGRYPILLSEDFSASETVEAAVVRVGQYYYVAPRIDERSGYAYEFIRRRIGDDHTVSDLSQLYIKQSKDLYDLAQFGEVQDCIDYQYGAESSTTTATPAPTNTSPSPVEDANRANRAS